MSQLRGVPIVPVYVQKTHTDSKSSKWRCSLESNIFCSRTVILSLPWYIFSPFASIRQSYIHQVLQTIQMKLILLCVWAEPAVLGSAKSALKFKYKTQIGYNSYTIQCMGQDISLKSKRKNPWFKPWFNILCTHIQMCVPLYKVNVWSTWCI